MSPVVVSVSQTALLQLENSCVCVGTRAALPTPVTSGHLGLPDIIICFWSIFRR